MVRLGNDGMEILVAHLKLIPAIVAALPSLALAPYIRKRLYKSDPGNLRNFLINCPNPVPAPVATVTSARASPSVFGDLCIASLQTSSIASTQSRRRPGRSAREGGASLASTPIVGGTNAVTETGRRRLQLRSRRQHRRRRRLPEGGAWEFDEFDGEVDEEEP